MNQSLRLPIAWGLSEELLRRPTRLQELRGFGLTTSGAGREVGYSDSWALGVQKQGALEHLAEDLGFVVEFQGPLQLL